MDFSGLYKAYVGALVIFFVLGGLTFWGVHSLWVYLSHHIAFHWK